MLDKPATDQQSHGEQNRNNRQPILPCPPQREQEAHTQHDTRNLAGHNVEPAERQQRADQTGSQVASWEGEELLAAAHVRDAALVRVQADALDAPAGAARGDGVAELVEGDDQHLARSQSRELSGFKMEERAYLERP